jgi:hypothetical protein
MRPSLTSSNAKNVWLWKHKALWWNAEPWELESFGSDLFTHLVDLMKKDGIYRHTTWAYDIHRWTLPRMAKLKSMTKKELLGKEV